MVLDHSLMPEIPLVGRAFHSKSEMQLKDISRGRRPGRPAHTGPGQEVGPATWDGES